MRTFTTFYIWYEHKLTMRPSSTNVKVNDNFKTTTLKEGPPELTYLALLWKPLVGLYVQVNEHDEHI